MNATDSNGNILKDGDTVQVIKDLKVKGASMTLKRGKTFKNIRLTSKSVKSNAARGRARSF